MEAPSVSDAFRSYLRSTLVLQVLLALVLVAIVLLAVFTGVLEEREARAHNRIVQGTVRSLQETAFLGFMPRVKASIQLAPDQRVLEVSITRKAAKSYRVGGPIEVFVHPTRDDVVVPTRMENAPFFAGLCFLLFTTIWLLLILALWVESRLYVDLFRTGVRVEGDVTMLTRYHGFPLWQLEYEADGRPLRRSCVLPPGMSGEGPCVVAYDPKKPKRAIGLGPI